MGVTNKSNLGNYKYYNLGLNLSSIKPYNYRPAQGVNANGNYHIAKYDIPTDSSSIGARLASGNVT